MIDGQCVSDSLQNRSVTVSGNVNGHTPKGGKTTWSANIWINGYAFSGIEWDSEEEANRDCERAMAALNSWRVKP